MDKKRKDSVIRATVDRAALLRGVLMLTALALLLCFGLKPSRAAAPDAEDGALTASDASARLSAECELLQRVTFSPCGHEMTRRQRLPAELAGMTKDELAAKYDQWVITSFSPAQVSMERALALYCPEHVVLIVPGWGSMTRSRWRSGWKACSRKSPPHCTPIRAACPADFTVLFASSEEVCYNDSELSR